MTRKGRKQQNALATLLCRGWRGKNIFLGTKIYFPRHVLIFSSGGFSYIASLSSLFPKQIFLQQAMPRIGDHVSFMYLGEVIEEGSGAGRAHNS